MCLPTRHPVVLLGLLALGGCAAAAKENAVSALRDASDTLLDISEMTLELNEGPDTEQLYSLEERIADACRELIAGANYRLQGQEIPVETQLGAVLTAEHCRNVVQMTRRDILELKVRLTESPGPD